MLNYIWFGMLIFGFFIGILNGRINEVTNAAFDSAAAAIELCIALAGLMCLWTGLMEIASKGGLVKLLSKLMEPLLRRLFPDIPKEHPVMDSIVMNITANFLGMGNAATPLGIKAMEGLAKLDGHSGRANYSMSMFVVMNTSAMQLIPTTVIAIRSAQGAKIAADIALPVWIVSISAVLVGITAVRLLCRTRKDGNRK